MPTWCDSTYILFFNQLLYHLYRGDVYCQPSSMERNKLAGMRNSCCFGIFALVLTFPAADIQAMAQHTALTAYAFAPFPAVDEVSRLFCLTCRSCMLKGNSWELRSRMQMQTMQH